MGPGNESVLQDASSLEVRAAAPHEKPNVAQMLDDELRETGGDVPYPYLDDVAPACRREGLGRMAAQRLVRSHPGAWHMSVRLGY
jgi:hypothetical protein